MDIAFASLWISMVLLGLYVFLTSGGGSLQKGAREKFAGCPTDFNPTQFYVNQEGGEGIAFSEGQQAICLVKPHDGFPSHREA